MDANKWLTLPDDLLVDIFRRLGITAVIRSAGACRHWRRTIIHSCLRPRPDRFLPHLLLGFLDKLSAFRLQYVSATDTEVPSLFTPATDDVGVDVFVDGRLYNNLFSSRDGFLLLGETTGHKSLCLCSAETGSCKVLPTASMFDDKSRYFMGSMYVLATGNDVDGDEAAVWILAVNWQRDCKDGVIYQIFSSKSGEWGPVRCSAKFPEDVTHACTKPSTKYATVVCHGAVSWFVNLHPDPEFPKPRIRKCMFSVDLRSERTWTTEIPIHSDLVLVVTENGQLSLVTMLDYSDKIQVWVLAGDDVGRRTPWRTIDDVQKLLPNCPSMSEPDMCLSGFCPSSGYLFGTVTDDQDRDHHFVIGVDGSSARLIGGGPESSSSDARFPYEMNSSNYIASCISKMKYF